MYAVRIVPLVLAVLFALGCSSRDASVPSRRAAKEGTTATFESAQNVAPYAAAAVDATAPAATPPVPGAADGVGFPRQLVRNASLQVVVSDVDSASQRAQALAISLGGYVAHVDHQRPEGVPSASLVLRVPVARLDEALAALRRMGVRVEHEQQGVQDVTEQVVDLDARLRTLTSTEHELRALLAESTRRGQKLEGVMAVYRELTEIRTRIEQLQGQREALEKMATLSTISLRFTPAVSGLPVAGTGWRPGETLRNSLRALVGGLRVVADFAIFLVVVIAPLAALVGLPLVLTIRLLRRRSMRSA